jgi:DNA ligase-1
MQEVQDFYVKCLENKEEGSIIKNHNAIWKNGTSTEQYKVKLEFDCELEIIGFNQGDANKIFADTLGSLICASVDRKLQVNVSGMKEDIRYEIWDNRDKYLGKIITVTAHRVLNKTGYTLYLPRLKEIREDKTNADTLERILESEQNALYSKKLSNTKG